MAVRCPGKVPRKRLSISALFSAGTAKAARLAAGCTVKVTSVPLFCDLSVVASTNFNVHAYLFYIDLVLARAFIQLCLGVPMSPEAGQLSCSPSS